MSEIVVVSVDIIPVEGGSLLENFTPESIASGGGGVTESIIQGEEAVIFFVFVIEIP